MGWWGDKWDYVKRLHDPRDLGWRDVEGDATKQAANEERLRLLDSLRGSAEKAGAFAGYGQAQYGDRTQDMLGQRDALQRLSRGEDSYSAEQLRQTLGQNQAAQQSMAAGARPGNAAMAARTSAINQGRLGAGLAGQQALAGIQERQAANQQLNQLLGGMRGQDLMAALQSRSTEASAYGQAVQPIEDKEENKGLNAVGQAAAMYFGSDRRIKKDIADGDDDARQLLEGLRAHTYKYKDDRYGKGTQLGVMAQDLEKTHLGKQAVIDTPQGKMVDGAKLAGALAAASSSLHKRLSKLEKGR